MVTHGMHAVKTADLLKPTHSTLEGRSIHCGSVSRQFRTSKQSRHGTLNTSRTAIVVTASAENKSASTLVKASLVCTNAFRDDWVLDKTGADEPLGIEVNDINNYLTKAGIDPVRPRDLQRLVDEEGYTLVDNRMQWSYDEWHLETAIHIPMLRVIQGNGLAKQVRRFGHVVFTEFPTMERNFDGPDAWMETITKRFPDLQTTLIMGCDIGGLLSDDPSRRFPSPSFEALFYLKNLGYTNVKYLQA